MKYTFSFPLFKLQLLFSKASRKQSRGPCTETSKTELQQSQQTTVKKRKVANSAQINSIVDDSNVPPDPIQTRSQNALRKKEHIEDPWIRCYEALLRFAAREGHYNVPMSHQETDYNDIIPLGEWLEHQRGPFFRRKLKKEHFTYLKNLVQEGKLWTPSDNNGQ